MDIDAFVSAHRADWDRLDLLLRRRKLSGTEVDELVALYQRTATHLSAVRSSTPDPALLGRLSTLVARARSAVTGAHGPAWKDVLLFFSARFPAAVYRARVWWVPTGLAFVLVCAGLGWWIAAEPTVQSSLAAPDHIEQLTRPGGEFESYYSSDPAGSFALQVWTNNVLVAAGVLILGVVPVVPVVYLLWQNVLNLSVGAGLMASVGRFDVFLGLVSPHGLLELTAVFVAAGVGLRLGWTVIDPGARRRGTALATEGRAAVGVALGLVVVLLVSGVIEAFVTPRDWSTWVRVGIGVVAEVLFLVYVFVVGRRAALAGETGDLDPYSREATAPVSA